MPSGPEANRVPRLGVRLVTGLDEFDTLRHGWEALERAPSDHGATFFQSFAWCRHVARIRLQRSPARFRLLVAALYDGPRLAGVWPLSLQRRSGLWTLCTLDAPFGQLAGILCGRADWIEPGVAAVLAQVRTSRLADAISIANVIEGSPLQCALIAAGAKTGRSNEIVQVDMRGAATFVDYQRTLNTKTRKNLRNAMNRLTRHGDVVHSVLTPHGSDGTDLTALIKQTFDGRLAWMQQLGKSTDAFRDADFRPLVESVCAADGLHPIGFELRARGEVIASQWGFAHEGRYYAYISARDQDHDQFSPGRLHLGSVIEACKSRGLDVLELMAPAARYKVMWSNRVTGIHDMWLPFSARARVTLGVLGIATPAVHAMARALPPALKSRLARRLNSR